MAKANIDDRRRRHDRRKLQDRRRQASNASVNADFLPDVCSTYAIFLLILAAELLAVLLVVANTGLQGMTWAQLGLVSVEVQWVALASAALLCYLRPHLGKMTPLAAGSVSYLLVLAIAFIFAVIGQVLLKGLGRGFVDWWQVASHVLMGGLLSSILLRYLYLQQQLRNQQQAELQSRIQALQSRIQPHFLFNSMNSIASLIATDQDKAERVVEDLSDLFRASLAQATLVPISQELSLCEGYVRIEQLRLGERLQIIWNVDESLAGVLIPSLLLQPLLENAIGHGIEPLPEGGQVIVDIYTDEQDLVLSISNPMATIKSTPVTRVKGNQMALENIRHRLSAHFGDEACMLVQNDNNKFVTIIRINYSQCQQE